MRIIQGLTANNFAPANATVAFAQDTVKNPADAPETNCTLTTNVPTYFIKVLAPLAAGSWQRVINT
jgi:hypothetical protein